MKKGGGGRGKGIGEKEEELVYFYDELSTKNLIF